MKTICPPNFPTKLWDSLANYEREVCVLRFGFTKFGPCTLRETADLTGLTLQQIRIAESKIMAYLKHPTQAQ